MCIHVCTFVCGCVWQWDLLCVYTDSSCVCTFESACVNVFGLLCKWSSGERRSEGTYCVCGRLGKGGGKVLHVWLSGKGGQKVLRVSTRDFCNGLQRWYVHPSPLFFVV